MWIRIEMAPLEPDPATYWEYGSGSGYGSKLVKMVSKKENDLRFQVKKSIDHFVEGIMILASAQESSINVFKAVRD